LESCNSSRLSLAHPVRDTGGAIRNVAVLEYSLALVTVMRALLFLRERQIP
jgi:hypothetical protein